MAGSKTLTASNVRRAAMDLLARREHGLQELETKLLRRFGEAELAEPELTLPELVAAAVNQLQAEGLQSDTRMAEMFVRARANKGHGPVKIRMELKAKGLSGSAIDNGFEANAINWAQKAAEAAAKKFGTEPLDIHAKSKQQRFLQQRGFSFDQIQSLDSN